MSDYKKHVLAYVFIAALIFAVLFFYRAVPLTVQTFLPAFLIGLFYTFLPDVDIPSSKLRVTLTKLSLAVILCCLSVYAFYLKDMKLVFLSIGLTAFLYVLEFAKHRGIFHSVVAGLLLSAPLYFVNLYFFVFAIIGFLMHLLVDGAFLES